MAVYLVATIQRFIGLDADAKPAGVPIGSRFWAYDTKKWYVCYDGTNWAAES